MKTLLVLFLFIFCYSSIYAEDWTGKCVSVIDGDTIGVLYEEKVEKIRLDRIDCPESTQAFGTKAKQATAYCVFNKEVKIKDHGKDKYGRTLGEVIFNGNISLNQSLVKSGVAWWYKEYAKDDKVLEALEKEARENKRGLWVDKNPVAPWDFRHKKIEEPKTYLQDESFSISEEEKKERELSLQKQQENVERSRIPRQIELNKIEESFIAETDEGYMRMYINRYDNGSFSIGRTEKIESIDGCPLNISNNSNLSNNSRQIHTGPRGGKYYINSHGNKTYVKRKKH